MDLWDNLTGLCRPLGGESNPQHVHLNTAFKWQPALCQKELPGEAKHLNSTKKKRYQQPKQALRLTEGCPIQVFVGSR